MGKIVLDANWLWYYTQYGTGDAENCFSGNEWTIGRYFPKLPSCKYTCVVEGVDDYAGNYGITTRSLTLRFVTLQAYSPDPNIGSRVYLMKDDNAYEMFNPLAEEFTFDVDMSNFPSGIAADAHFSSMDGGRWDGPIGGMELGWAKVRHGKLRRPMPKGPKMGQWRGESPSYEKP